jgi:hypothetical protein
MVRWTNNDVWISCRVEGRVCQQLSSNVDSRSIFRQSNRAFRACVSVLLRAVMPDTWTPIPFATNTHQHPEAIRHHRNSQIFQGIRLIL